MSFQLDEATTQRFQERGVVVLRGVFTPWIDALTEAVRLAMAQPSPLERTYRPEDGSAPFFQDYVTWQRWEPLRRFVLESNAGEVAARLMRSPTARFFHDHMLVKEPGNSMVTPWHQDQPYYCVEGRQSVSFWTPLDTISREVCMECVAGSHRWSEVDFRPLRFSGLPLYAQDRYKPLPDIEANRSQYEIDAWALEPGDAIAFDFRTVHGAPANRSNTRRRVISTRWIGADTTWAVREGTTSPPFAHLAPLNLAHGAPLPASDFPQVYP